HDAPWGNVLLAGDWTATGLPATLEGAAQSGFAAAEALDSLGVAEA
ncbi:MAG: FAD-dependent oxidoreductase, partial [Opitutales bacterium]